MKIAASLIGLFFSIPIVAQNLPSSTRTEYIQISIGGTDGTSTTQDVAKGCVVFLIDANNIKEKDCGSENIAVSIKLVTSEPTKLFDNGWSKRFAGYDPNNFTKSPDGSINITDFYTIILKNNNYGVLHEVVSGSVSLATNHFNL